MNEVTKATSISPAVRKIVVERDKHRCIFCGDYRIQVAHYVPRSQLGMGIPENLACVCPNCHRLLDQSTKRKMLLMIFERYLKFKYPKWEKKKLIYKKYNL